MDFGDIIEGLKNLPQSQKDLRTVAKTIERVDDPKTQRMIAEARSDAEQYAYATLGLQVVSTVAIFGLFMMALSRHSNGKGPA